MSSLPPPESAFWQSPALTRQSDIYPPRFKGRVPMRVRMACRVTPDFPMTGPAASANELYVTWTNMHGAVSAILQDGTHLGLRPAEFDVEEWYDPPEGTCQRQRYRQQSHLRR